MFAIVASTYCQVVTSQSLYHLNVLVTSFRLEEILYNDRTRLDVFSGSDTTNLSISVHANSENFDVTLKSSSFSIIWRKCTRNKYL